MCACFTQYLSSTLIGLKEVLLLCEVCSAHFNIALRMCSESQFPCLCCVLYFCFAFSCSKHYPILVQCHVDGKSCSPCSVGNYRIVQCFSEYLGSSMNHGLLYWTLSYGCTTQHQGLLLSYSLFCLCDMPAYCGPAK